MMKEIAIVRNCRGTVSDEFSDALITKFGNLLLGDRSARLRLSEAAPETGSIALVLDSKTFESAAEVLQKDRKAKINLLEAHASTPELRSMAPFHPKCGLK